MDFVSLVNLQCSTCVRSTKRLWSACCSIVSTKLSTSQRIGVGGADWHSRPQCMMHALARLQTIPDKAAHLSTVIDQPWHTMLSHMLMLLEVKAQRLQLRSTNICNTVAPQTGYFPPSTPLFAICELYSWIGCTGIEVEGLDDGLTASMIKSNTSNGRLWSIHM